MKSLNEIVEVDRKCQRAISGGVRDARSSLKSSLVGFGSPLAEFRRSLSLEPKEPYHMRSTLFLGSA